MKYVMEALRKKDAERRRPVILMEIDYELVTLYDALLANDKVQTIEAKERLEELRLQYLKIENE